MSKMWINKVKVRKNRDYIFAITSIIVFIICIFAQMGGDDVTSMRVEEGTIAACWDKALYFYEVWSSRVLVNFVIFIFTSRNSIVWALYMGVSMYILQKAFSLLFVEKYIERKKYNLLISAIVFAFPFAEIAEVGWIATSCTYFGPIAFGFMSLVPIKKISKKVRINWWEYPAYIFCLIYGANNEQMMVVIVCSYLVAVGYCLFRHQINIFLIMMVLLSITSLVFILTCPGNYSREMAELVSNNPTYGMLDSVNKLELGMSTAVRYLLFSDKLYVLIVCVCFSVLMFEKYNDIMFRIISCIPIAVVGLLGVMKDTLSKFYPLIDIITQEVSQNRLISVNTGGGVRYMPVFYYGNYSNYNLHRDVFATK